MLNNKSKRRISPSLMMSISALAMGNLLLIGGLNRPAQALSNGQSAFEVAPHLLRTRAIGKESGASATYFFTITVPQASQPLQAIRISQVSGAEKLQFDNNRNRASLGDHFTKASLVPLVSIGGNNEPDVVIPFQTPIMPGQSVTVAVKVERNPRFDGSYQFGVTAFPVGENPSGLYLGTGRIDYSYSR